MLNTRETAIAIWLGAILVWALSRAETRSALIHVLRALAHIKILVPIAIAAGIAAGVVYGLHQLDFWETSELKDTIVWFFLTGVSMLYRGVSSSDPDLAIRKMARDSFAIILIAEFILNAYTFPLWAEILLFPLLVLLGLCQAIAQADPALSPVRKFLKIIQSLFGFMIIGLTLWGLYTNYGQVFSYTSLEASLLPIILSAAFIPLAYAMGLIAAYENLFLPLKIGIRKPPMLRAAARARLIFLLGWNLRAISEARRTLHFELGAIQTSADLDRALHLLRPAKSTASSQYSARQTTSPLPHDHQSTTL